MIRDQFFDAERLHEVETHDDLTEWYFVYEQINGRFHIGTHHATAGSIYHHRVALAVGYSGAGPRGVNNPDMVREVAVGPIPRGKWYIGRAQSHPRLGPVAIDLRPDLGTDTFGRSGFFIHGDNARGNKTASKGCIILPRWLREFIAGSGQLTLYVV